MPQQWPTSAPSVSPGTHDPVATQAYLAGGGDYFRSGFHSIGHPAPGTTSLVGNTLGRCHFTPFFAPVRMTFDRMGAQVGTAGGTGAVVRLGIYANAGGVPTSLILDAGTAATTSTGLKEVTISQSLDPGWYWLASVTQVVTCSLFWHSAIWLPMLAVSAIPGGSSAGYPVTASGVTGALPGTAAPGTSTSQFPAVTLRPA